MSQFKVESQQRLYQSNCFLDEEICSFSGKCFMRLLLEDEDEIASSCVIYLVALVFNGDGVAGRCAWRNGDSEIYSFLYYLPALARFTFARLTKYITHSFTSCAFLLHLCEHTRSHLSHFDCRSFTFAVRTSSSIYSTFSIAVLTNSSSLLEERYADTCIELF